MSVGAGVGAGAGVSSAGVGVTGAGIGAGAGFVPVNCAVTSMTLLTVGVVAFCISACSLRIASAISVTPSFAFSIA